MTSRESSSLRGEAPDRIDAPAEEPAPVGATTARGAPESSRPRPEPGGPMPLAFTPTEPFRPAWGAAGPQRQTLLAHLLRRPRPPLVRRERIDTHDGDFLDLDWLDAPKDVPHVLVLHGLEGTPDSG